MQRSGILFVRLTCVHAFRRKQSGLWEALSMRCALGAPTGARSLARVERGVWIRNTFPEDRAPPRFSWRKHSHA